VVDRVPATLLAALADLMKWLDAANMPSMVIGGVAASMLGQPRLTQDVDVLAILPEGEWANALSTAARDGILSRLDFSQSNALFDFGNCRFLLGKFIVSSLARPVAFGPFAIRQMARAKSFDKAIELLFIFKRRRGMSVDLLVSSHFLAVESHDTYLGFEEGILGNRMGHIRFFGANSQLFERGHRLKNGIIAYWSGARECWNASDGGRPEAANQGTTIDGRQTGIGRP
jgi:hypothetical protein